MAALRLSAAHLMLACAAAFTAPAGAEDTLRCDGSIVTLGMIAEPVIAKCGQPSRREAEDVPIRARSRSGASTVVGATRIERWTYDRGWGKFPALLTFEQGKLKHIELLTRAPR